MLIAIDFDGTVVTHEYPKIGKDIGAVPVLKALVDKGHRLLLNTMRSGKELEEALEWFKENDIKLSGVGKAPGQWRWTTSTKCHADLYIDDMALGVPLSKTPLSDKPYVDWIKVKEMLGV